MDKITLCRVWHIYYQLYVSLSLTCFSQSPHCNGGNHNMGGDRRWALIGRCKIGSSYRWTNNDNILWLLYTWRWGGAWHASKDAFKAPGRQRLGGHGQPSPVSARASFNTGRGGRDPADTRPPTHPGWGIPEGRVPGISQTPRHSITSSPPLGREGGAVKPWQEREGKKDRSFSRTRKCKPKPKQNQYPEV